MIHDPTRSCRQIFWPPLLQIWQRAGEPVAHLQCHPKPVKSRRTPASVSKGELGSDPKQWHRWFHPAPQRPPSGLTAPIKHLRGIIGTGLDLNAPQDHGMVTAIGSMPHQAHCSGQTEANRDILESAWLLKHMRATQDSMHG